MAGGEEYHGVQLHNRLSDEDVDRVEVLRPIDGDTDTPVVPLEIAVEPLIGLIPCVHLHAVAILERCRSPPADGLTVDESAAIMLYLVDWKPIEKSLYAQLNAALRGATRDELEPWLMYRKLFLTALARLPSTRRPIYRASRFNLSDYYPIGEIVRWSGFASGTTSLDILQSEVFREATEPRTLFIINSFSGKEITNHCCYPSQGGLVLLPPAQFKVTDCALQNNGVHRIHLEEVLPFSPCLYTAVTRANPTQWKQNGVFLTKRLHEGSHLSSLRLPKAICIDDEDTIYIADWGNRHVMAWRAGATVGELVAGGNGSGDGLHQFNKPVHVAVDRRRGHLYVSDSGSRRVVRWPLRNGTSGEVIISDIHCRGLAVDHEGYLYASNYDVHEVRRWKVGEAHGALVAGGNGIGDGLNQLLCPSNIVVDNQQSLYVVDHGHARVMKWPKDATEGIQVAGGHSGPIQLSAPLGLVVDELDTIYVTDWLEHRVVRWPKGATQWEIIIDKQRGGQRPGSIDSPAGLAMDRQKRLYVLEGQTHRLQRFDIAPS